MFWVQNISKIFLTSNPGGGGLMASAKLKSCPQSLSKINFVRQHHLRKVPLLTTLMLGVDGRAPP